MSDFGDRSFGQTLRFKFTTVNASGVPTTLGNSPSLAYFVDNDTTLYTSGLTLTADYASKTGLNDVAVVVTTSCTGLVSGTDVQLVVAAGTVSGVSMIGYVVGSYAIYKESALRPTTVGRTLAVAATGGAAIDWANIGNPTTSVNLSGTTIGALTSNSDKTGYSLSSSQTFDMTGNITGNLSGSVGSVTGNVGGNVVGSVASVSGAVGSVTGNVGGSVGSVTDVSNIFTTQMTESYRANGAAPTLAQAACEVLAQLGEASISGTTKTINKFDHATSAETFTLDSATDPSSITRAT